MPGTTYTRTGPENDPVGRLADFSRFAVQELDELYITPELKEALAGSAIPTRRLRALVAIAQNALADVGGILHGYTTADD